MANRSGATSGRGDLAPPAAAPALPAGDTGAGLEWVDPPPAGDVGADAWEEKRVTYARHYEEITFCSLIRPLFVYSVDLL